MALTYDQMFTASYPAVLSEMRKGYNQWSESAALREFERVGMIQRIDFGDGINVPLDYRVNPDTAVLATDQDENAFLDQQILTSAVYQVAQISVPVIWTKGDEARNPAPSQKVSIVKQKLENGINSHDDMMEQCFFTSSTAGGDELLGFNTLIPTSGQGTPGGVDAVTEVWWRNFADTYTDVTDIEATMTEAWNTCAKGSGSSLAPSTLIGGAEAQAMYEAQLQSMQRFVDVKEADAGWKVLAFKSARFVFSQYGDDKIYFLNPKSYNVLVSKQYFRDKGNTVEDSRQNTFSFKIYSACQNVVNNKSRLAVISL